MMRRPFSILTLLWIASLLQLTTSQSILDFEDDFGAIPDDRSHEIARQNSALLSAALELASERTLLIPPGRTFYLEHGVRGDHLHDIVIQIDGTLHFVRNHHETNDDQTHKRPSPCLTLHRCHNVTLTSSRPNGQRGVIDGGGPEWWGLPVVGYVQIQEHRPVLLQLNLTQHALVEHILLRDAPLYTMSFRDVNHVEVRYMSIVNRRTQKDGHGLLDLTAFNTDGIDVSGHNVYVHDVDIWNQDDCIAVKDNFYGESNISSNMVFQRINASGLGLTIGSIGGSTVRNITFRDSYLHKSFKGIYLKFREPNMTYWHTHGLIEDILFENITMEAPQQWAIWIGPAQQSDSVNVCKGNPCSLCWPWVPFASCRAVDQSKYRNITLRNVTINNPKGSPGVILGNENNMIESITFDNVVVTHDTTGLARMVAFPALEQSNIRDPYVHRGRVLYRVGIASFILVCLACIVSRFWRRCDGRQMVPTEDLDEIPSKESLQEGNRNVQARAFPDDMPNESVLEYTRKPRRKWLKIIVALSVLLSIAFIAGHLIQVNRRLSNNAKYFACRGVNNAVALGSTWPVPHCFDDQTDLGEL